MFSKEKRLILSKNSEFRGVLICPISIPFPQLHSTCKNQQPWNYIYKKQQSTVNGRYRTCLEYPPKSPLQENHHYLACLAAPWCSNYVLRFCMSIWHPLITGPNYQPHVYLSYKSACLKLTFHEQIQGCAPTHLLI